MEGRKTGYYWVKEYDKWRVEFFSNAKSAG